MEVLTLAASISAAREGSYVGHDCRGRGHSRPSRSARPRLKGARVVLRSRTGSPALRSDGGGLQPPAGDQPRNHTEPVQTRCAAGNPAIADRTACAAEPGAANANATIA